MWMRPLLLTLALSVAGGAAVTRIHVVERSDVLSGRSTGPAGAYERIIAKAHFAVDPKNAANRIITDLDRAPRNERGLVEFSADVYLLKPRDPRLGNGTLLFEVPNRGGKGMLGMFNFAPSSRDPRTEAEFGDKYLLEQGYTLLWIGWQFDVPNAPGIMRLTTPTAGPDITGRVRSDFVLDKAVRSASLGDMGHQAYGAANLQDPTAQLTVRDRMEGERRVIPRAQWQFAHDEDGRPVPDPTSVYLASGFAAGKIYEVLYTAKEPPVVGLGLAAVRDTISFLKYGGPSLFLSDQQEHVKRAIGFGTSQSGRFLRHFLYQGFNADESQRQVFDGVWAHVAGAGRGNFNARFAQPSRDARPFLNFFYPVDIYPFMDLGEAGLLARTEKAHVTPRIFYTNGSYEYWGRAASLIHTTPDGKADAPIAPNTRIYFNTGAQHTIGFVPPRRINTRNWSDPEDYRFQMRALLMALQAWLKDGKEPPASQYPRLDKGQLVEPERMPRIDGEPVPAYYHKAYQVDYGPQFVKAGIMQEPPKVGAPYRVLVPQVNSDGNETSGIRLPEIQVPLGTYTGWNYRDGSMGAPDEMASFIGSYFPFARTKAQREAAHDYRLSIEERYPSREAYLERYRAAAQKLAKEGYVLDRDLPRLQARAELLWQMILQ